jgi:hypothetical protein
MRGGGYLLARLVGSGVLRAQEPLLEASIKMAGQLAPGRQSGHIKGRPLLGLSHTRLGGRGAASLRCLGGRGVIAGWGAMDG